MRIALLCLPGRTVPPPAFAPIETVVDGLAQGLQRLGHDVVLFASEDSTCPVLLQKGIGNADPREIDNRAGEIRYVMDAYRLIDDDNRFDIVHDHTLIGPAFAHSRPDLSVVTTNHGPWDANLTPVFARVSGRVPVICISRSQASLAPQNVRIAGVAYNPVDASAYEPKLSAGEYLAFLGRIDPVKGVHLAIEAALRTGLPIKVAGRIEVPSEREYFDAKIRPLLGDSVEFVGEIGGDAKREFVQDAIALVNPICWDEPFGLVMIEALASGAPVIAFGRGAAPEIVRDGETGFIVHDEAGLDNAISRIGEIDRKRCFEDVRDRFSFERCAEQHVAIYRTLIEGAQK